MAALAIDAPVQLVTNDRHWPATPFGHALFQRCTNALEAYGAGIKISVDTTDTIGQSASSIARQLEQT